MRSKKLKIILSGMMASDPHQGGATWAVLQYALGLRELGHDVAVIEPILPAKLRPQGSRLADSMNARYFCTVTRRFELLPSALLISDTCETFGASYDELLRFSERADVLINISGMLTDEAITMSIKRRVYLDLDPAFVQLWHSQGIDMRIGRHTHFATIGQNIGRPGCRIPTCGVDWITILQPVVLSHWRKTSEPVTPTLTTVANWRGYGSVDHDGKLFGQKAHSVRQLFALPTMLDVEVKLALAIHPDEENDLAALRKNDWKWIDPQTVAGTPRDYQCFIQRSWAELGIAKSGYVVSACGWFSDRSACYLASGRPVLAQDTGIGGPLEDRPGFITFRTLEDAVTGVEALERDYERHCRGARAIAEDCLRSDLVLTQLLQAVGAL